MKFKSYLITFISGLLFSAGLSMAGMTNPDKVKNFLDITGNFDPSLMLVMIGALGVNFVTFYFILKRKTPLFDKQFHVGQNTTIDKKLIVGSALFGIGWGISGICPGPSMANLLSGDYHFLAFVLAMFAGMGLFAAEASATK
jgi:uncharacterized membrane protein YedE/YeeE